MTRVCWQVSLAVLSSALISCSSPTATKPAAPAVEPKAAKAQPFDADGYTPLTRAARDGDVEAVRRLLDAGASSDERSRVGDTPLCYAVWHLKPAVAELLIARGANPNLPGAKGTPLLFAVQRGRPELVKMLLGVPGIDVNGGHPQHLAPLGYAIGETFRPVVARLLLERGAEIDFVDAEGWTALMWACWRGRSVEQVRFILQHGADPARQNRDRETAYVKAAQAANLDLMRELESRGAKRGDVRLGRPENVDPRLTPAQRWALAATALRTMVDGKSVEILGGFPVKRPSQQIMRESLTRVWRIEDRDGLLLRLHELEVEGQRLAFARWAHAAASDERWAALPEDGKPPREAVLNAWQEIGGKIGVAWDLCRYIKLADEGFFAGYLTEAEAWARILPAARTLQKHFDGWAELGTAYLAARKLWLRGGGDDALPRMQYLYHLLTNGGDSSSPWIKNDWKTPLGDGPALPL